MVNQAFCTLGKVWLVWFENQRSLVVQPGLHPGKPWFNQAFGARERPGGIRKWHIVNFDIDEKFLGPMEYFFNCNVTSKSQLYLCCIKNSFK